MSSSLQSYGLYPTSLPCPWDSPGKNTEVGGHTLLQGIFPTQGLNPWLLPRLLHYRWILSLLLNHLEGGRDVRTLLGAEVSGRRVCEF